MSNIYVTEPPTSGKILLCTSKGDIEVELWAKECPKACRNIIALALEGYYDDQIWHRIVPNFCLQTGDPSGSGTGGESFYGEPFEDEVHQRLRFNKRGLVAMANSGERDQNESQFFITLDSTPELQNKHTLFGRVSGPTIYNVLALSEVELSETEPDRPVYPPKLLTIKVLDNPFDDIVPRITRKEKLEQEANRKKAKAESGKRREKVKKNTGLLSFGEAEEGSSAETGQYRGGQSIHDLLKKDKRVSDKALAKVAQETPDPGPHQFGSQRGETSKAAGESVKASPPSSRRKSPPLQAPIDLSALRSSNAAASSSTQRSAEEILALEASIRGLSKRSGEDKADEEERKRKREGRKGKDLLAEMRQQYGGTSKKSSKKSADEKDTLAALRKFQSGHKEERSKAEAADRAAQTARSIIKEQQGKKEESAAREEEGEEDEQGTREYGAEDGDDQDKQSWRSHRFQDSTLASQSSRDHYDVDEYVTLDPRDTSSASAAKLGFGSDEARKREEEQRRRQSGRRGRDWVVDGDGDGDESHRHHHHHHHHREGDRDRHRNRNRDGDRNRQRYDDRPRRTEQRW